MVDPSKLVEVLEENGFEVEYSPEKGEIRAKGEVKRIDLFGVEEIEITNGEKFLEYFRHDGDNFIEVYDNDDDDDEVPEPVYLGRDLEVIVRYVDGYLVIIFNNSK